MVASGMIDAHAHIFPPEMVRDRTSLLERDPWFRVLYGSPVARMVTAEELVEAMDAGGVDLTVVFGFAFADQGLCRLMNDYVLDAVSAHAGRLAGLCCVSPDRPGAVAELERCLDAGMRGCGELAPDGQGWGDAFLPCLADGGAGARPVGARAGMDAVAACLSERGPPLLVHSNEPVGHSYAGKGGFTPEGCLSWRAAYPDLTVVCAHGRRSLPLRTHARGAADSQPRLLRHQCCALISIVPMSTRSPYRAPGADKLLFGSDYLPFPREIPTGSPPWI